jgi:hypothetical protein
LDTLGHGYVGKAKPVLSDMHNLIFHGLAPSERFSLRAESTETGLRYWEVHK